MDIPRAPACGVDNVEQMLGGRIDGAIVYGTVSLYSPRQQDTTMYVGSRFSFKVWLNGVLIYESFGYNRRVLITRIFSRSHFGRAKMSC